MAMQTGSDSTMPWDQFYNISLAHLHIENYTIIPDPTQLKSNPMFMNKDAVLAAPLEEEEVADLVMSEEVVAALLPPLQIPT
jgi:hypothetical protein